jgi:hypothetical protein
MRLTTGDVIGSPSSLDKARAALCRELRKRIEVQESGEFWGQPYTRIPRFVESFFGDGQQLVCIQPLNTRPNLYVIRVDSIVKLRDDSTSTTSDLMMHSLMDEIYNAIEDEYGSSDDEDEENEDDGEDEDEDEETDTPNAARAQESKPWPALNLNAGACWFEYDKKTVAQLLGESR